MKTKTPAPPLDEDPAVASMTGGSASASSSIARPAASRPTPGAGRWAASPPGAKHRSPSMKRAVRSRWPHDRRAHRHRGRRRGDRERTPARDPDRSHLYASEDRPCRGASRLRRAAGNGRPAAACRCRSGRGRDRRRRPGVVVEAAPGRGARRQGQAHHPSRHRQHAEADLRRAQRRRLRR